MDVLIAILVTWIVAGIALLGVGLLLTRSVTPNHSNDRAYFDAFWLGLGATIALAQLWHLWLPINAAFPLLIVGLGLLGIVISTARTDVVYLARQSPHALIAFAIGAIWLAMM